MTIATIISITGQAWARDASGELRELRVGDTLQEGETLVTSDNGRVLLDFADGLDPVVIGNGQEVAISADLDAEQPVAAEEASVQDEDLEALLAALEEGEGDLLEGLDATAAGAGGAGGPGGGHDFVRLARISENVDPLSFEYGLNTLEGTSEVEGQALDEVQDSFPTVETIDLDGDGDMVWESALTDGSGGGSLTTSGALQIDTGSDLLALIEVRDADGNWVEILADATQVAGVYGVLTVNTDGSWSYTLSDNSLDHEGTGAVGTADQLQDLFGVRVTDDDGDVSAPATLAIAINDDGPEAQDDMAGLVEDGESSVVSGNVLVNDIAGADAPASFVGWGDNGAALTELAKYGTLTLDANGDYRFELDNSDPDVQALSASDAVSETLTYTMRDAEGDTSQASLTITIGGAADSAGVTVAARGIPGVTEVYEAGLEPDGSNADGDGETAGGSFSVFATDGIASLTLGGQTFTLDELKQFNDQSSDPIDTGEGSLVITGYSSNDGDVNATITYEYTLKEAQDHSGADSDERVSDSIEGSLTGVGGSSSSGTLIIDIVDDVPQAADDAVGEIAENSSVSIDVFGNDTGGADGVDLATGVVIASGPGKGSVVYNGDGTFTYTAAAGAEGNDSFSYTITDADGDTATATVTLSVAEDSTPTVSVADASVDETGGLESDTQAFSTTYGNDSAGTLALSASGATWNETTNTLTADNGDWQIVVNGDGTYTVTQLQVMTHPDGTDPNDPITVNVTANITDNEGDPATDTFSVTFLDDGPVAANDSTTTAEDTAVTYNVLANDAQGVDGATVTGIVSTNGAGSAVVTGTDSVTYTPAAGEAGSIEVVYEITDGDGDTSQATLTIEIGADSTPSVTVANASVDETGGLESDTQAFSTTYGNDSAGTLTLSAAGATWSETTNTLTADNGDWQIVVNGDGTYTVTQLQVMTHPDGTDPNDPITVNVTANITDNEGDPATDTFSVTFLDDGPVAANDSTTTAEDTAVTYNVLANDAQGVDGATVTGIVSTNGAGSAVVTGTDSVTYTPAAGEAGSIEVVYEITDGDGDTSQATLTIEIGADSTPSVTVANASVDETGGLDADTQAFSTTYGNDSAGTLALSASGATWNGTTNTLTADNGDWQIVVNGDGTYTVTQLQAMSHPDGSDPNDPITVNVTANITDNEGDPAQDSFTVTFLDDGPTFTNIMDAIIANESGTTVTGFHDLEFGTDGLGELSVNDPTNDSLNGSVTYITSINADGSVTKLAQVSGSDFFTLTVKPDGTYDFTLHEARPSTSQSVNFASVNGQQAVEDLVIGDVTFSAVDTNENGSIGNAETLKPTSAGFGVGSGNVDAGEQFAISFTNAVLVDSVSFDIKHQGSTNFVMSWVTDTGEKGFTAPLSNDGWVSIDPSLDFTKITFTIEQGSGKIDGVEYDQLLLPDDTVFEFDIKGADADGDSSASQTLSVTILGGESSDAKINGTIGDDVVAGTSSSDTFLGGQGDDVLAGGLGADTFVWNFGDQGTTTDPAEDSVTDFTLGSFGVDDNADKLDISDLLSNMDVGSDLSSFIQAEDSGTNTVLHISTTGGLTSGGSGISGADQTIVLEGVAAGADPADFIESLIQTNQLDIE
ncbi:retention module-containing protein [Halomonas denitrificans]|uniref:retention module-containing protein n=1 Tax=Halomonas denitrificans TaxID=370769 RepID=UPI000D337710|nr:retention module-containing protein [Halomonas denitrificans]